MAEKCHGCKIVETYKYWSEFPPTNHQFFKVMLTLNHLEIPTKFIECFKEKLASWCTLIGPSQNKWKVKLTRSIKDEKSVSAKFSDGWEKFVSDNSIEEGDFLVFRYGGDSTFEVVVFDKSGCEREGSYFAMNTSLSSSNPRICNSTLHCMISSNSASSSEEVIVVEDESKDNDVEEENESDSSWENDGEFDDEEMEESMAKRISRRNINIEKTPQSQKYYISKRRELTQAEKQRGSKLALEYMRKHRSGKPVFRISLLPTHVYRGFHLTIPKMWAMEHMLKEPHEVELRVPGAGVGKSWTIGCRWTMKPSKQCQFRGRWPSFVLENNLEEHDACVFELIQKGELDKKTPIFNVHIFRAIDRIVPLFVSKRMV